MRDIIIHHYIITIMKRSIILFILLVVMAIICDAQPITKQQAEQKAMAFMKQKGISVERGVSNVPLSQITVGKSPFYVFNATDGEGFVIVSGDERTEEILGYGLDSRFDEIKISESMREWLTEYATQIDDVQMGRMKVSPLKVNTHEAIGKMVSSVWDQGEASINGDAFNQLCPTDQQGRHCQTGCVATAMAQVMYYHKWPTDKCSQIPGFTSDQIASYVSSLPPLEFDWSHMLNRYDEGQTPQECKAVAQLMQYCGSALKTNYGTYSSNAYSEDVALALRNYFDYDVNTRYVYRDDYSTEGWDNLIYSELKNGRPVLYDGYKINSGHAFVCDGYDGHGFYHINWGWGGYCNGYYKLSILNPNTGNTGSINSGYTMNHGAVVGIQKPTGTTQEERTLSLSDFYYDGHTISAQYTNRTGLTGTFDYGFAYKKASDGSTSYLLKISTDSFEPWESHTYLLDLEEIDLSDGTYFFYPYAILSGNPLLHILYDSTKYFEVKVRGGKVSGIKNHPVENWYIKSIECVSNHIVLQPQEIQVTIKNEGEDFNGIFYLHVSNTDADDYIEGSMDFVSLPIEAGGQETTSLYFTPTSLGKWEVWVDNTWSGVSDASHLEIEIIHATTTDSNLSVESYEIISNTDAIFKATIKNNGTAGYYMPIHCYLYEPPSKSYNIDFQQTRNMNIAPGETADVEFRFESLEMGKTYIVCMGAHKYHNSYEMVWIGHSYNFTVDEEGDPTDIDKIHIDQTTPVDIYSLSGILLREKTTTFEGIPKGIYIVNGKKVVIRK